MPKFKALQHKLLRMDTTGWSIPEQVDWHIVRAEMNGYDFNYRILKPGYATRHFTNQYG